MAKYTLPLHPILKLRSRLIAPVLAASLFLSAGAAHAVSSSSVFFEGNGGFGTSMAMAMAAELDGISIDVVDESATSGNISGLTITRNFNDASAVASGGTDSLSTWTVTNNTGAALFYLGFVTPLPTTLLLDQGTPDPSDDINLPVVYDPQDVGLGLTSGGSDPDWVIINIPLDPNPDVYYPAVSFGSGLAPGESAQFTVNYLLNDPVIAIDPSTFKLGVPQWQLFRVIVPEPSTGLLLSFGVAWLAARTRRRS